MVCHQVLFLLIATIQATHQQQELVNLKCSMLVIPIAFQLHFLFEEKGISLFFLHELLLIYRKMLFKHDFTDILQKFSKQNYVSLAALFPLNCDYVFMGYLINL